ncbi:MAG: glutamine-hydrolyzing GMP synthase, partial [Firmicutes bacterium]|nr:glutamine-hydrolyzing GMP synthase [Bacillota bacterium]
MNHELIIVLDFGGQYNQLIARRVRDFSVYCEVKSFRTPLDEIRKLSPKGIIFTGGPNSVYDPESPHIGKEIFELGIPILGICYGCQLMAYTLGGTVESASEKSEYGKTPITLDTTGTLFSGLEKTQICWMSHTDYISKAPEGFKVTAFTNTCPAAAMENEEKKLYGVQFHPEVNHTENGIEMLGNFVFNVCGCKGDWVISDYIKGQLEKIKTQIGDGKALCALSGGVDSSVAAALVSKAIGRQLTCVFVDHGLMRKNEGDEVENVFKNMFDSNFVRVNAEERFLKKLSGVTDPEQKRKIIGEEFIRVFEDEAKKIGKVDFLVQGTIYPDVIESGLGDSAVIKSHHNVGGLPSVVDFKELIEPLRLLFKDEVRKMGLELGLPDYIVWRQPFPGPGLAIRVIGEITKDKLDILRDADAIFREEIKKAGLERSIDQYFAVITDIRSVGVMGDGRTYDYTLALRGVTTSD